VQAQIRAEVVPDRHSVAPDLQRAFGDHTFFLNATGLTIVEATPADEKVGSIVTLARWVDAARTQLKVQPPEPTPVQVTLGPASDEPEPRQ
jgi:hypothetical protein